MAMTITLSKEQSAAIKTIMETKGKTSDEAKDWFLRTAVTRAKALLKHDEVKAARKRKGKPSKATAEKVAKASAKKNKAEEKPAKKAAKVAKAVAKPEKSAKSEKAKASSKKLLQDNTKAAKKPKKAAAVEVAADDLDLDFE